MDNKKLIVSSTPHIRDEETTAKIMLDVCLALLPATIMGVYRFGASAAALILITCATAVLFEWGYEKILKKPITITDFSAVVTGLLIAFNLPAAAPLWIGVVGSFFGIVVVKQLFGGIGQNFLNPALTARAFLLTAYTPIMTDWSIGPNKIDAVTTATPLAQLKTGFTPALADYSKAFWGEVGGTIGETCAWALLIGGVYLIARKIISWRIPVFYGLSLALVTWVFGRGGGFFTGFPIYELLTGGFLLGAIFMATDYTTSPITPRGQIIYAIGCGLIAGVIRAKSGGYPEGISYSILIMNLAVPLIDRFIRPKVFGARKKEKKGGKK